MDGCVCMAEYVCRWCMCVCVCVCVCACALKILNAKKRKPFFVIGTTPNRTAFWLAHFCYDRQMIHCDLIYDIIRSLCNEFTVR